ncbi:relaxase/mobilization nuclease domain-containing protein [Cellulomonas hominis]|uniref:relaxase/mobilization nuclease domain-containing protein n=1 Tax=Cellulomonas hominis TaxID=156981 RepID=UPI001B9113E1|nr:relaxase/mobilization nuclease domain-containing protein [Cellulomonas hominis]VTR76046.1 hypothetical protein CHMI_00802 [Cellulomonas hominis]
MIARCFRGGKAVGLAVYLAGPGKRNEHTFPHVLGGHEAVISQVGTGELSREDAVALGQALEMPTKVFGTKVRQRVKVRNEGEQRQQHVGYRDAHVYHVPLSLEAGEGPLPDEQWAAIATDFVAEMGFAGEGVDGPQCRWMVVRHGLSTEGNDHVHVVVNLVREDGSKANLNNDFHRIQAAANRLEHRYGLRVLESREQGRGTLSAAHAAELGKVERRALSLPPREELRRRMHAVAVTATSEKEYLDGLKNARVLVRPRLEKGSTDRVVGYSVALVPTFADGKRQDPIWYAPSKLDRTLGLGQLRMRWGTDAAADGALAPVWRGQWKDGVVSDKVDVRAAPEVGTVALARLNERMSAGDERAAAADIAGVLARASLLQEKDQPGPLARASEEFARIAQPDRYDARGAGPKVDLRALMGAAYKARLIARATGTDTSSGWMAVLRQAQRTGQAVARSHAARGHLERATTASHAADAAFATLPALRQPAPVAAPTARRAAPTMRVDRGPAPDAGRDAGQGYGVGG